MKTISGVILAVFSAFALASAEGVVSVQRSPLGAISASTITPIGVTASGCIQTGTTGDKLKANCSTTQDVRVGTGGLSTAGQLIADGSATVKGNAFSVGGSTLVVANGRLGIGTASPSSTLVAYDAGTNSRIAVQNSLTGTTSTDGMSVELGSTAGYLWLYENSLLQFGTANTARMTIAADGNIGVRTAAPVDAMEVSMTGNQGTVWGYSDNNTTAGKLIFRKSRGTRSSPTATQSGDDLAVIGARGYGATVWASTSTGALMFNAAENFTDSTMGTYGSIYTTAIGTTSRSERIRIADNGNVGIGTTTPATQSHVWASGQTESRIEAAGANSAILGLKNGNGQWSLYAPGSTGNLSVYDESAGGGTKFSIEKAANGGDISLSGNVGIDTTEPGAKLHVVGDAYVTTSLTASSITAQGAGKFGDALEAKSLNARQALASVGDVGDGLGFAIVASGGNSASIQPVKESAVGNDAAGMKFNAWNGSETKLLARLTSSQRLGVATDSPAVTLDVNGAAQFGSGATKSTFTSAGILNNFSNITVTDTSLIALTQIPSHYFQHYGGRMYFHNGGEAFTILDANSNVGIGNATPGAKLDVNGDTAFRGASTIVGSMSVTGLISGSVTPGSVDLSTVALALDGKYDKTGGAISGNVSIGGNSFTVGVSTLVASGGNVGVGTDSPVAPLHIKAVTSVPSTDEQTGHFRLGTQNTTGLNMGISPGTGGMANGSWLQSTNQPATGGTAFGLFLNPLGGNVGISTMNPSALFSVADKFVATSGGNIGIGTTAPGAKLDVNGDSALRGAVTVAAASTTLHGDLALASGGDAQADIAADTSLALTLQSLTDAPYLEFSRKSDSIGDTGGLGRIRWFAGSSAQNLVAEVRGEVSGTSEDAGDIIFYTKSTGGAIAARAKISNAGSLIANGAFRPAIKTKAQFDAITPALGDMYLCSDCTVPYDTCVATGATISGFRAVLNSAINTVVPGTLVPKGCGSGE